MAQRYSFTRHNDNQQEVVAAEHINELQRAIELIDTSSALASTPYTADSEDHTIIADASGGAITINLPAAASSTGYRYTIKRISASNNVIVDANASETIDGATTKTITTQYGAITILCNGTAWYITSQMGTIT